MASFFSDDDEDMHSSSEADNLSPGRPAPRPSAPAAALGQGPRPSAAVVSPERKGSPPRPGPASRLSAPRRTEPARPSSVGRHPAAAKQLATAKQPAALRQSLPAKQPARTNMPGAVRAKQAGVPPQVAKQPGVPLQARVRKTLTRFSDDESSPNEDASHVEQLERSKTALQKQSDKLRVELDQWKGKVDELQEKIEESEQSWSHEQRRRKAQWEEERARLEHENEQLQRRLREWVPMQHEDEKSCLMREILATVSRARATLQNQSVELVRYSEQITEENRQLEDRVRAQALCVEQQQVSTERLHAEIQQLDEEAQELRESEARGQEEQLAQAQSASHERLIAADLRVRLQQLQGEEQAECRHFEWTCQQLRDERAEEAMESHGARGLQSSCNQLEKELRDCRKAELSEFSCLRGACNQLEQQLWEHQQSTQLTCRKLEGSCHQFEEELMRCRRVEGSECSQLENMYQQLQEEFREGSHVQALESQMRQQLQEELIESRRLEGCEFHRLQCVCSHLEEELHAALAEAEADATIAGATRCVQERTPHRVQVRRASGTFAALACAYARAAAACKQSYTQEEQREDKVLMQGRRPSGLVEALNWAYSAAAQRIPLKDCAKNSTITERNLQGMGQRLAAGEDTGPWYAQELAEQRMQAEAEVAESRQAITHLWAELARQEAAPAESARAPDDRSERRVLELEARCEASAAELCCLRAQLKGLASGQHPGPLFMVHGDSETWLSEASLVSALKRMQACTAWLSSLPAAHIEVLLPLVQGAGHLSSTKLEQLQVALAQSMAHRAVVPQDVDIDLLHGTLRCVVHVRGCRSIRAVSEELAKMLQHPGGGFGAALAATRASEGLAQVLLKWPLERLQAEIEFEYGYMLTLPQLEKLVPVLAESGALYDRAWELARSKAPSEAEALSGRGSMSRFEGRLLPVHEGCQRQLLEDWSLHGSALLSNHRDTAAKAQLNLKASDQQSCLDESPGVRHLGPILRLSIVLESIESIQRSMDWIISHFHVLWIDNRFYNPSCLGCRDVIIAVRQQVPVSTAPSAPLLTRLSEIVLSLRELNNIRQGEGRQLYDGIRNAFMQFGVKPKDADNVRRITLRVLDCTDGRAAREAMWDLCYCSDRCDMQVSSLTEAAEFLLRDVRREARAKAKAAGVPDQQIVRVEEAAIAAARLARTPAVYGMKMMQVERHGFVETGMNSSEDARTSAQLRSARSELAELRALCGHLEESEAAYAERHCTSTEAAERMQRQVLVVEARAFTLNEELKQSQASPRMQRQRELLLPGALPGALTPCTVEDSPCKIWHGHNNLVQCTSPVGHIPLDVEHDPDLGRQDLYFSGLGANETPRSASMQSPQSPLNKSCTTERKRLVGLAKTSAVTVARLLKEVRGLNDARVVLASGGLDAASAASQLSAVQALELQTIQLERTNHEWASSLIGRTAPSRSEVAGRDWSDSPSQHPASPIDRGTSGWAADSGPKDRSATAILHGAGLTGALRHTAHRLERLHCRLSDLNPSGIAGS